MERLFSSTLHLCHRSAGFGSTILLILKAKLKEQLLSGNIQFLKYDIWQIYLYSTAQNMS